MAENDKSFFIKAVTELRITLILTFSTIVGLYNIFIGLNSETGSYGIILTIILSLIVICCFGVAFYYNIRFLKAQRKKNSLIIKVRDFQKEAKRRIHALNQKNEKIKTDSLNAINIAEVNQSLLLDTITSELTYSLAQINNLLDRLDSNSIVNKREALRALYDFLFTSLGMILKSKSYINHHSDIDGSFFLSTKRNGQQEFVKLWQDRFSLANDVKTIKTKKFEKNADPLLNILYELDAEYFEDNLYKPKSSNLVFCNGVEEQIDDYKLYKENIPFYQDNRIIIIEGFGGSYESIFSIDSKNVEFNLDIANLVAIYGKLLYKLVLIFKIN